MDYVEKEQLEREEEEDKEEEHGDKGYEPDAYDEMVDQAMQSLDSSLMELLDDWAKSKNLYYGGLSKRVKVINHLISTLESKERYYKGMKYNFITDKWICRYCETDPCGCKWVGGSYAPIFTPSDRVIPEHYELDHLGNKTDTIKPEYVIKGKAKYPKLSIPEDKLKEILELVQNESMRVGAFPLDQVLKDLKDELWGEEKKEMRGE